MPISAPVPKAPAEKKAPAKRTPPPQPEDITAARASGLTEWFSIGGMLSVMRGNLADAQACSDHGEAISRSVAAYAAANESVAKYVDMACQMGPVAGLLTVIGPFLLQIAVNHGRLPADALGVSSGVQPPEILESRMKLSIEQHRLALEREAHEARAEYDKLVSERTKETTA